MKCPHCGLSLDAPDGGCERWGLYFGHPFTSKMELALEGGGYRCRDCGGEWEYTLRDSMILDERSKHLRRLIVRGLLGGNCGHIGASMSLVEILRVLYDDVMKYDPKNPKWPERDRCILSKGHGCLALYAILADKGFFPVEELDKFCRKGALLGGHPSAEVPGVEAATGSLGHGLSIGVGMALAARIQGRNSRVFVVVGDGEIQEGSVWEAAMSAAKHKLSNLTVIVDYNTVQSAGHVMDVCPLEPLKDKWEAFGFETYECDGHNVGVLEAEFYQYGDANEVLASNLHLRLQGRRPLAIITHTVKGKGIPWAEGDPLWHHRPHFDEATAKALQEAVA